jgi:2-polyprenyl-3-methyl-5-hydroxy-6-metoxy-1,4-benzoquinol methylase
MHRYYPPEYYGSGERYHPFLERLLRTLYARRARRVQRMQGKAPGFALDVGCGRGHLLRELRLLGWRVMGTELSDVSARYARDVFHLDVRTANLEDLALPDAEVDVVILWHVLEHVPEPSSLLGEIARVLRPGGTLLVAVPNFGSFEARLTKWRWFHLDVPRHLNHSTRMSLEKMLRDVRLRPYAVSFVAPEYDTFSFVQSTLNALGLRHNALYNLIRTRGAKPIQGATRRAPVAWFDVAATLALAPVFGMISISWSPLVALLRQGATMTYFARKESAP